MKKRLVHLECGEVEHPAIPAAFGERRIHALGRKAVIAEHDRLLSAQRFDIQPFKPFHSGMKELRGTASASVAAPVERCFELLEAVDQYPDWYPEVVRSVEVVERDGDGRPKKANASLHVSYGPLTRDFRLLLAVQAERLRAVRLTRIANEPSDQELFEVAWRLRDGPETRIELELNANLSVPRFLPVGGIGEGIAHGFVAAAARALG